MTEQERSAKLNTRLNQWQAYVEQPQTALTQEDLGQAPIRRTLGPGDVELFADSSAETSSPPFQDSPPERPDPFTAAVYVDSVVTRCETQIAGLQMLVEQERQQSRRLAEQLKREQRPYPVPFEPRRKPASTTGTSKIQSIVLLLVVLVIAGMSSFLVYSFGR